MEVREFLLALRRHALWVAFVCLSAAVVTALLVPEILPEKYEATALVLVRPNESFSVTAMPEDKQLLNFPVGGGMPSTEIPSNTYIQIIQSRAVAEKVVRLLRLDEEGRGEPERSEGTWSTVKATLRELYNDTVHILKYGRVLSDAPPFERAVKEYQDNIALNTIKDAYQFEIRFTSSDPNLAAQVANAAASLFVEHMGELNLGASARALSFLEEKVLGSAEELASARELLREFKERNETVDFQEEAAAEITILATLETNLEETDVELSGLLQELTPENPKVLKLQAEKERLVASLDQRREKMRDLPEKERQLAALQMNVDIADEIYQLLNKEYETARIQVGKVFREIEIVSPAVAPLYPSSPILVKFVAAALALALLIGFGIALLLEYLDDKLRTVAGVERGLGLKVLATLPPMAGHPSPAPQANQD